MPMCVLFPLRHLGCRLLLAVDLQSFYLEFSTSTNTFGLLSSVLVDRIRLTSKQVARGLRNAELHLMLIDL